MGRTRGRSLGRSIFQNSSHDINAVILDFDGTIADSGDIFLETFEEILNRPKLTDKEIDDIRGLSTREIMKKLGIKKWQVPMLISKGRRSVTQKMKRVKIFDGMTVTLSSLTDNGYNLYLLSTNSKEAIADFLRRYNLEHTMSGIYAGTSLFGKARRLKSLLRKERLTNGQCVYVGDETRDIEAARRVGIRSVAVLWGFNTPAALKSYMPDATVSKPADLLQTITSINSLGNK